ncbi:hypothetical protein Tco_1323767 [Tanacetum coccineum]
MSHIRAKFESIDFDCLLNINEQIVPRFVLEFYSQLTFDYNSTGYFVVNFVIPLTLEEFGQLLKIPFKAQVSHTRINRHVFTRLTVSNKCFRVKGRYKTTPPSPSVVKSFIQIPQQDRGKKRPRESNASSSSTSLNHPSSSHLLDDTLDENDDESFHSNSSSPSQNISSSSNVVSRVRQNPPHESHNLNTYISETINLQTQQRDAHREGLRSIGQALKNMMGGKRK